MKAYLTLDPQNSPTANWYPELKNDTCALSPSYKSGNVVIPGVTNTTACEHRYFQGWKDWCSSSKHAVGCIPQYYQKALDIDPTIKNALDGIGIALNDQLKHVQAIQYFKKALAIDPNDTFALTGIGNALDGQGNYTQALQYFKKALAIDPNYKSALHGKQKAISELFPR